MAVDATNTTYPLARDPLPQIGPNTPEDGDGVEHDVVHDRAHAVLNALQDLLGTLEAPPSATVLQRLAALELGGSPDLASGEAVVADGVSPPQMLTDDAETDFLYQD